MADSNITQLIIANLPAQAGINKMVDLINKEVEKLKAKYVNKIKEFLLNFKGGTCPTKEEIKEIINKRNNIVESLTKVYNKVDRLADNISGIGSFLSLILTAIKISTGLARSLSLGTIASPFPIPGAISSGISAAQSEIESRKFKADGAQKLVPISAGLISASIVIKIFANILAELIGLVENLDIVLVECSSQPPLNTPLEQRERVQIELEREVREQLIPIDPAIIAFVEQDVEEQENSLLESYRGFNFKIEKIPFSPTVNRSRALANNSEGITLLRSELSFTSTPKILIEELKFVIDRDNLRAE